MLAIEGDYIVGFDVYKHKDALKMYNCRWNPDVKKWKVPDNIDKLKFYIDRVNTNEKESIKECWEQALKNCGHERVAKGTEQYLQVKTEMKRLLAEKNV
jgi:hypothetical protein